MSNFADWGCHVVSVAVFSPFFYWSRYFSFHVAPHLNSRGWMNPVQTHYFSENLVALGIEPGPLDLQPWTLTTGGTNSADKRRSLGRFS
jgi:hypothetical protein